MVTKRREKKRGNRENKSFRYVARYAIGLAGLTADKNDSDEKDSKIHLRVGKWDQIRAVGLCSHLRMTELEEEDPPPKVECNQLVLPEWLQQYRDVFSELTTTDREGRVKHIIKLQEGATPSNRKPYRMSQDQKDALHKELSKFISRG